MIVISGRDVPASKRDENTKAIALRIIHSLSGVTVADREVKDCHRMGKKILLSFIHAGTCSPISRIVSNKRAMHRSGTYINVRQCPHDRKISFTARQMKKAGILDFVGTSLGSLTRVGKDGQKYTIHSLEDLQRLTDQPLSNFMNGVADLDDSAVVMES